MWRPPSAPVAQLDRVPDYESGGRRFESFRVRQHKGPSRTGWAFMFVDHGLFELSDSKQQSCVEGQSEATANPSGFEFRSRSEDG